MDVGVRRGVAGGVPLRRCVSVKGGSRVLGLPRRWEVRALIFISSSNFALIAQIHILHRTTIARAKNHSAERHLPGHTKSSGGDQHHRLHPARPVPAPAVDVAPLAPAREGVHPRLVKIRFVQQGGAVVRGVGTAADRAPGAQGGRPAPAVGGFHVARKPLEGVGGARSRSRRCPRCGKDCERRCARVLRRGVFGRRIADHPSAGSGGGVRSREGR